MKAQYQSTEAIKLRFAPFVDHTTGHYIIGTDTCNVTRLKPDGTNDTVAMSWNATIQMWTLDIAVGSYQQGEWRFHAVSNDANAQDQWKVIFWGDYVNDTIALNTKLGTPVAGTVSLDIAAIQTKLGTPAGASVSVDIATLQSTLTTILALATSHIVFSGVA